MQHDLHVEDGTCGVKPEAALKILIPFGDITRPDKLGHCMLVSRLAGHQNFPEQIYMPNINLRPLKACPARTAFVSSGLPRKVLTR